MGLVNKTKLFENIGSNIAVESLHTGPGILLGFSAIWIAGTTGAQINPLTESSIWINLFDQDNKQIVGTLESPLDVGVVISQGSFEWFNPYTGALTESIDTLKDLKPASGNQGIGVFVGGLSINYVMDEVNTQSQSMSISYNLIAFE